MSIEQSDPKRSIIGRVVDVPSINFPTGERISFRMRTLWLRDLKFLDELIERELSDRECAVELIHHQLLEPKFTVDEVRAWPDDVLLYVSRVWSEDHYTLQDYIAVDTFSFAAFKGAIIAYLDRYHTMMREIYEQAIVPISSLVQEFRGVVFPQLPNIKSAVRFMDDWRSSIVSVQETLRADIQSALGNMTNIGQALASATSAIGQNMTQIMETVRPKIEVGNLFRNLPNLAELIAAARELDQAEGSLRLAGYGFTEHLWYDLNSSLWNEALFVGFAKVHPQVRNAHITKRLLKITQGEDFKDDLYKLLEETPLLRRRKAVIISAFEAHRRKEFTLSVPALLAQVDGILTDLMILRGEVKAARNKFYAVDEFGNIKIGRDKKPIEVMSLRRKIDHSRFNNEPVLERIRELILNTLMSERDAILHGQNLSYGKAKHSTRALLLLYVLSVELSAVESGKITA